MHCTGSIEQGTLAFSLIKIQLNFSPTNLERNKYGGRGFEEFALLWGYYNIQKSWSASGK